MPETTIGIWADYMNGEESPRVTVLSSFKHEVAQIDADAVVNAYIGAITMALPQGVQMLEPTGRFVGRPGMSLEAQAEAEMGIQRALATIDLDQVAEPFRRH